MHKHITWVVHYDDPFDEVELRGTLGNQQVVSFYSAENLQAILYPSFFNTDTTALNITDALSFNHELVIATLLNFCIPLQTMWQPLN